MANAVSQSADCLSRHMTKKANPITLTPYGQAPLGLEGSGAFRRPGSIVCVLRTERWVRPTEWAGSEGSFICRRRMLFMLYDKESQSRNADFISIAPKEETTRRRQAATTLGPKGRQPSPLNLLNPLNPGRGAAPWRSGPLYPLYS